MVSGGTLHTGDEVVVLPAGTRTRIASLRTFDGPLEQAVARMSVTVQLEDDLDITRGDMLATAYGAPEVVGELEATLCWFGPSPVKAGQQFRIKHTTRVTQAGSSVSRPASTSVRSSSRRQAPSPTTRSALPAWQWRPRWRPTLIG